MFLSTFPLSYSSVHQTRQLERGTVFSKVDLLKSSAEACILLDTKNLVVLVLFWTNIGRYSLWKCLNSKQNFVSILITYIATVLMYHSISWSENVSSYRIFTKKKKKSKFIRRCVFNLSMLFCYFKEILWKDYYQTSSFHIPMSAVSHVMFLCLVTLLSFFFFCIGISKPYSVYNFQ